MFLIADGAGRLNWAKTSSIYLDQMKDKVSLNARAFFAARALVNITKITFLAAVPMSKSLLNYLPNVIQETGENKVKIF